MQTRNVSHTLVTLFRELLHGPERPGQAYMLNTGDIGLLRSLDAISADTASRTSQGGASIAAHVDHLRYGLSLMNAWSGGANPWDFADFTRSWRISTVTDAEWQDLRSRLQDESQRWVDAMRSKRELTDEEVNIVFAVTAHLAYHLGAIRQIDKATRGPQAEGH
jgi:hypothetical protein